MMHELRQSQLWKWWWLHDHRRWRLHWLRWQWMYNRRRRRLCKLWWWWYGVRSRHVTACTRPEIHGSQGRGRKNSSSWVLSHSIWQCTLGLIWQLENVGPFEFLQYNRIHCIIVWPTLPCKWFEVRVFLCSYSAIWSMWKLEMNVPAQECSTGPGFQAGYSYHVHHSTLIPFQTCPSTYEQV